MLIQQVEGVITLRTDGNDVDGDRTIEIAAGCLRLCGCDPAEVSDAVRRAADIQSRNSPHARRSGTWPGLD